MGAQRFFAYTDTSWVREGCAARLDQAEPAHCWHRGMLTYTSLPTQHDETCCYCGETIRVQDPPLPGFSFSIPIGEHGPYHPQTFIVNSGRKP